MRCACLVCSVRQGLQESSGDNGAEFPSSDAGSVPLVSSTWLHILQYVYPLLLYIHHRRDIPKVIENDRNSILKRDVYLATRAVVPFNLG